MAGNIPNSEMQNAPSKDLWQHLIDDKMYDKGYDEFEREYSTSDKVDELHDKLSSDELYTNTKEDFYSDYFPNLKKNKSLSTDSQVGGSEIPQSESVSISTSPKETIVTETKSEIKPTTNDLSSPTSKDGEEPLLPIPPGAKPPTKSLISAIKDKDELYQKKLFALTDEERNQVQKQIDENQSYLDELKVDNKKTDDIRKELEKIPNSYLNTVYQVDDDGTEHNMKEYLSNARENNYPFYKMFLANLKVQDMLEFDPKIGKDKIQSFYNDNKLGVLTYTPGQDSYTIVNESEYVKNEYNRLKKIVKANGADATKANEDLNRLKENPKEYFKDNQNALKDIEKIETETPVSQQKVGLYVPATQEQVVDVLQNIDDYTTKTTDVVKNSTRNGGTLQTEALTTLGDGASQFVKDYVDPVSASQYLVKKIGSRVYKGVVNGTLQYKPGNYVENPNQPDETNNDITNPYQPFVEKKEGNLDQDANLNNYSLESIRQKLDPNSLIDKLAYDIYAHSVGIDDAIMEASANPKYADKISDAAINYAISVDPELKKQYEALGNQLPEDVVAKLKLDFMNDPYVQSVMGDPAQRVRIKEEYKQRTGKEVSNDVFNNELLSKGKSDFIRDFKSFAVKDIAVKISNERQQRGMGNSVLDIPTQGEIDPLVDDMVAKGQLTPQEAEIYKTDIKQDISVFRSLASAATTAFGGGTIFLKNPIQTNDFFGQAQQGWGQGLISVDKSLLNWASTGMSMMPNTPTMIGAENMLTKEHALARMMSDGVVTKFVPNEATAVWGNMGNTTGFLGFLIAGGSSLKTLGLTEEVAHSLSAASVFYSTNYEKALQQFPGNDMKDMMMRTASTNIHTLVDVFFIKALPKGTATGKMRDALVDDINVTLQELKSGVITNVEATAKINTRLYTTAKNIAGASVNTANVMTGLSATQEAIGSFLGENNKDISDIVNEGVDNYLPTMLSTAVVSTYTGIRQKGARLNGENIADLAKNYDYFSDRLDKMVQENPSSKKEVDDMRSNLDAIRNAYNSVQDESFKDLTPEQKEKYVALSLYENANMNKATSTSDVAASKKFADIANEIRKQKTQILDNKDKAPEHKQYTVTLPKNDFDDTKNQTGVSSGLGDGKTSEQTQSQQGTSTETTSASGVLQTSGTEGEGARTGKEVNEVKAVADNFNNAIADAEKRLKENPNDEKAINDLNEAKIKLQQFNQDPVKYFEDEKAKTLEDLNKAVEKGTPKEELNIEEVTKNYDKLIEQAKEYGKTEVPKQEGVGEVEVPKQEQEQKGVEEVKPQSVTIKAGETTTNLTTTEPIKGQRNDVTWKKGESETLTTEGEGGQKPPPQEPSAEGDIYEEERRTIFKHRGLQEVATEFGLEDISSREKKSDLQLFKDAENTIDSWVSDGSYENNVSKIIESAENKKPLSDEENVILSQHISNLRAEMNEMDINSPEYDTKLKELQRVIKAGEATRSAQGAALRVPTLSTKARYDLPVMLAQKMADLNVEELTPAQKEGVKKQYEDIKAKLAIAEEKNRILEEKIAEAKAQQEVNNMSANRPRKANKTSEDFKSERKTLKEKLAQQIKDYKAAGQKMGLASDGGAESFIISAKMAKTIIEIGKSHVEEIGNNLKEITQRTFEDIKDLFEGITEKDIHDVFAGKYNAKKKTKSQLQNDWKDLAEEAKLINELETLMSGDESKLTEKQKIEKNQKIKELKDKIKSYKEESGIADKERIAKAEETARENIAKLEEKIDNNDIEFDNIKKPTSTQLEEYRNTQRKLRKQLDDMRKEAKVGKYSDQAKLDAAEKQALQNIKDLEEKIDNNDIEFDNTEKPTSDQLNEYREKQKQLRKKLDDMRKEAKVGRYSDEAKLSSAEKSALKNIKDLEDKLNSNEIQFDKVDKPTSAQLEEYRNKQRKLRKELEQRRKDAKMGRYSDEEKIKSAEKAALLSIKDLEEKIDNNDIEFDNTEKPTSAQLEEYRKKQKELRKELDNMRKEAKVGRYSDEAKLSSAEKTAQKNIEDLENKLANNDLSFEKVENPTSAQLEEYRNKQKALRKELEKRRKEAKVGRYSDEEKIKSAEKAAKENIEELENKLANNELEFDNTEKPTSEQLEEYRNKQKALRKELEKRRKEAKVGRYSDEARIKKAEKDLEESIKDLEKDIAENKIEVEQAQKVNSPKLEQLRQRQKELLKEKEQKRKEQKVGRYSDLAKLKALKEANLRAAQKIKDKIAKGEFEPEQKTPFLDDLNLPKQHPKEYQEAMDAIREKEEAQYEFEKARMADQMSKRPKVVKWIVDPVRMGINTITAIKAGVDNSFAFVQAGLTILNPANVKSTVKAFKEQTLDFFSQARFERELSNLHNNKALWNLIEKCKLDILDPRELSESKKDEVFGKKSFLNVPIKIGGKSFVIGKYTTAPFERLYTSLGNNLRLNLFLERVNELQAEGKTPETHLKEYQDAARTINEMTGRGKLHKGIAKSTEAISTVVWSPRMLASSLNILGLGDIVNIANKSGEKGYYASLEGSKVNLKSIEGIKGSASDFYKSPKGYALRQTIGGISGALSLMYLWSLNPDKEVDLDPRSVSFGTVYDKKSGNSYSVLGRYTSIIRLISMFITGEKRAGNRTTELDESRSYGSKRVEEIYKFSRGKFNPVSGEVADFVMQRTYDGKPYVVNGLGERTLVPMSVVEIAKGLEQQGWGGILKRGFPAFYGVKVTNEADFANPLYSAEEINTTPELSTLIQGEIFIPGLKKIDEIEIDKDKNHPNGRMTEAEYKEYVQFKKDRFKEKSKEILNAKWEGTNVRTEDVIYATAEGLNKVMVTKNGITMPKLQDIINQANKKIDSEFFDKKGIKRPITQEVEWKPTEGDIFTPDQKKQDHFKVYEKKGIKIPTMEVKSQIEIDEDKKHPNKEMTDEEYNIFRQKVAEYYDAELSNILYSVYKSDELDEDGIKIGKDVEFGSDLDKYKIKKGNKETNALQELVNKKYQIVKDAVLKEMELKKEKKGKSWDTKTQIKY